MLVGSHVRYGHRKVVEHWLVLRLYIRGDREDGKIGVLVLPYLGRSLLLFFHHLEGLLRVR